VWLARDASNFLEMCMAADVGWVFVWLVVSDDEVFVRVLKEVSSASIASEGRRDDNDKH
jgi:hypothetical protein